jgi:Co/Zn/Cd efflux system component
MSLAAAEFLGLVGLVFCLTGAWLHWGMHERIARLEDEQKDGTMTEDQAKVRSRFWHIIAPVITVIGVLLIAAALYGRLG